MNWPCFDLINGDEGFTIRLDGRLPPQRIGLYVVSLEGCERRFDYAPTREDIAGYVADHEELLSEPDRYLGLWLDELARQHVLDTNDIIAGRRSALAEAKSRKQHSVFDLGRGVCVPVERSSWQGPFPYGPARTIADRLSEDSGVEEDQAIVVVESKIIRTARPAPATVSGRRNLGNTDAAPPDPRWPRCGALRPGCRSGSWP